MGLSNDKIKDAGMAFTLIFLLAGLWGGYSWALYVAAAALFLNMIRPPIFTPFAYLWYQLSEISGFISSRIILGLIFFLIVTPVGLGRRLWGKDTLRLRAFKKGRGSAFKIREHTFDAKGMEELF